MRGKTCARACASRPTTARSASSSSRSGCGAASAEPALVPKRQALEERRHLRAVDVLLEERLPVGRGHLLQHGGEHPRLDRLEGEVPHEGAEEGEKVRIALLGAAL